MQKKFAELRHKFLFYTHRIEKLNENNIESSVENRSEKGILKT